MAPLLTLVVGLGKTGKSVANYLKKRNIPFIVYDTRACPEGVEAFKQAFPEVEVFLQEFPEAKFANIKEIIVSPGLAADAPVFLQAAQRNIPCIGDIECLARELQVPIIAITGTNGKSTVTTLVGQMAEKAGFSVAVAGNIGTPVLELLDDGRQYDLWVLELSSFQLDLTYSLQPLVATILNVSEDHLDRHGTLSAYIAAKQKIYKNTKHIVFNREDLATFPEGMDANIKKTSVGLTLPEMQEWGITVEETQAYFAFGKKAFFPANALLIKGKHNWYNALVACALASIAGISQEHILAVLTTFTGLAHRAQWVRNKAGVDWINDSKGTNVGATLSAIQGLGASLQGKMVLLAGGEGKGADFCLLRTAIEKHVRTLILFGKDAKRIEAAIGSIVPIFHVHTLKEAVQLAKQEALPGDIVLLSPACASLDMFRDFTHRGQVFTEEVLAL